ncbi:50S ribosomal protein L31 [Patescibacteria group bacterium]|nr:50S ribosomal protein L31 [Patescibacteria group bacterium]
MKAKVHPKWYPEATATCVCGSSFTLGATVEKIEVEVCSACHPFYTGKMKYVDTAGRVDAFKTKQAKAQKKVLSKVEKRKLKKKKRMDKELKKPETLEEVRKAISKRKVSKVKKVSKVSKVK